jgi:AcrR family transcriptional regulator
VSGVPGVAHQARTRSSEREPARPHPAGRSYDGTLRREQAGLTRERIVVAGSALLHGGSIRDWKRLTVRAVAERAGVSERTVYRHFGNERGLSDAVMHRLEEEAGIDLEGMELDDIATAATQILEHVASYPIEPRPPLDATLVDANRRQKEALLRAVVASADRWPEVDQVVAAALFDVLWSVETYERVVGDWQIEPTEAIRGVSWLIGLLEQAVRDGQGPS